VRRCEHSRELSVFGHREHESGACQDNAVHRPCHRDEGAE
jgi:hypothetical protein